MQAQNNVFILVDISKSIKQNELNDARQALNEILTGVPITKGFIAFGNQQDLTNFKLLSGDKLSISKIGSLQTTLLISPNPLLIQNINADVNQIISSIDWKVKDNQTYITLGKAKIAEYAKNHQLAKYKLYIISDNIQDDYGPGGKPNYPDPYTQNLAEGYNTTNGVDEGLATIKVKFAPNSLFTLSLFPSVNVSNYTLPKQSVYDTTSPPPSIILTSYGNGLKEIPKPTKSNSFSISWNCNCPANTRFNVSLTEYDGGKFRDLSKRDLMTNSVLFLDVPSGKFKVQVSAQNANSAITYIETPSSNLGWIIFLIIILVTGGIGYYFWNKKRQEKINKLSVNQTDDIFSSTGSSTNSSGNSGYF
jgi:hypothetical protein